MLMANSVEGRFPFLDREVCALADSLPARFKLRGLDEKRVLKRVAADLLPAAILERKKQPYRAPDAASFVGPGAPDVGARTCCRPTRVRAAGVFEPAAVDLVYRKCAAHDPAVPLSNADNMAMVGILSTQLAYDRLVRPAPGAPPVVAWTTLVEI